MKPRVSCFLFAAPVFFSLLGHASAADITKADNLNNLNLGTSWALGAAPGAGDIALWNNTVTGANSTVLGADMTWKGIKLVNPGGAVTIGAGNTLSLGSGGIDMSSATQDLTINSGVTLLDGSGKQTWNVAAGRTLTLAALPTKASGTTAILQLGTTGIIKIGTGTQNLLTDPQNNPYATFGLNDWAGLSSGTVVASTYTAATTAITANVINDIQGNITTALSGTTFVNAIRFNSATAYNVDIATGGSGAARTLTTGGILVTANSGGGSIGGNGNAFSSIRANRSTGSDANPLNIIQNSSSSFTIRANITNASSSTTRVVKSGTGLLILTGANSNTGGMTINEGTVQLGNGTTIGTYSTGAVVNNGAFSINHSDAFTFSNAISGTGSLTQAGSNTLTLGVNTYTGATNLNAGTVAFNAATNLGTGGAINFNGGTLQYGASHTTDISGRTVTVGAGGGTINTNGNNVTFASSIGNSGAGGLTKSGAGTLTLSNGSSYTGNTIISSGGGTLVANGSMAGGASVASGTTLGGSATYGGTITVSTGGIIAPGNSVGTITTNALTLGSGSILNFEFNTSPANDYINVTGSNGLTVNGGGFNLYVEGGVSPFSTVGNYNLIGYSGSIGGTGVGALSVLNPQAGKVYLFGSSPSNVTLGITTAGVISNWNVDASGSWGLAGNWSGAIPNGVGETANFDKALSAPRTVTLDGNRTLGSISFNGGASPLGYNIAQGTSGSLTLDNSVSQANVIVTTGSNTISADLAMSSTNSVFAVASGADLTISGGVSGVSTLVKSGSGTLDITGTSNGYSGATTVSGGTLGFAGLGSLGTAGINLDSGTLRYDTGNTADISTKTVTLSTGGGTINTNGNDVTLANSIGNSGTGGLTKAGSGKLSLASGNTYTGSNTITGGTLNIAGDTSLGAVPGSAGTNLTIAGGTVLQTSASFTMVANRGVALSGGTATVDTNGFNLSIAGNISGGGLLYKTGAGNLTLTSANSGTATGGITIDSGTVFTNDQSNLPSGTITLSGTGGISNGSNAANYNNVVVNGTNSIVKTGSNNIIGLGAVSGAGTLTFGGSYVNDYTGSMASFTGTIIANGGGSRWNGSTGGTNVTLDLANTGTSVRSAAGGITLGALAGSSTATLSGSGGGATQAVTYTIGGKTVGGLGVTPVDSTFDGAITNGANTTGLTKVGLSTLTLNGVSTYTGATTISAGTLLVNGTLGNTAVAVNNGGTLGGSNGTIGSATATVSVNNGGKLAPGNSPGTLTVNGSTTLNSGSTYAYQYTGNGTLADLVDVNGALTINTGAILTLEDLGAYTMGNKYTLFAYESLTGTFDAYANNSTYNFNGGDWMFNYADGSAGLNGGTVSGLAGSGFVTITAVPEPNAAMLVGGLGVLALLRRRRNA